MKVSNCHERLNEMMKIFDITQSDIVKRTGIPKSSLSNYVNGNRTPTQEQLSLIADPYGINPSWLMGYDVPMKVTESIINAAIQTRHSGIEYTPENFVDYNEDTALFLKAQKLGELYYMASPEVRAAVDLLLEAAQLKP